MGYDLWLVDHPLTPAKAMNLVGLQKFTFIEHQAFLRWLDERLPPCEGVFHLGACSRTTETDWDFLYTNNVAYSQALWTWCARTIVPSCMRRVLRLMAMAPMGLMIVRRLHNSSH